jgi:hypothetical protein
MPFFPIGEASKDSWACAIAPVVGKWMRKPPQAKKPQKME